MSGKGAVLSLKITGDASGGKAAIDDVEGKASGLGDTFGKLAGLAAGAFAVDKVLDFGKASFDAASDLEQMQGSVDAVFGSLGDARVQMTKWSLDAAKSVGLSEAAYDQMASVIGSQLKNAGVPIDQLAGKTNDLIQKGADMSAVFGGSAADAVEALSAVMRGEFDPIERYGVSLNQTAINAEVARRGQANLTGAALRQAQVTAALDLVTKQTASTQGQFAAQSNTAAEKSQQLAAWFDNLKAKLGSYLLPTFVALTTFLSTKVGPIIEKLTSDTGPLGNIFGAVGDFLTEQLIPAVSSLWDQLAPKLIPAFQQAGSFLSNVLIPAFRGVWSIVDQYVIPIFRAVLVPIISGVTQVWHSLETALENNKGKFIDLYNKVKPFLDFLKNDVAPFVGTTLKLAFEGLSKVLGPLITSITWILDKAGAVLGFLGKAGSFLFNPGGRFGAAAPAGGGAAPRGAGLFGAARTAVAAGAARLFGAGSSGGVGVGPTGTAGGLNLGGDTYIITVQGALDPTAVADQIAGLLDKRARRLGQRPAFGS